MAEIKIRLARVDDLREINSIYNYYVAASTCTYQTEPETAEARAEWFSQHGERYPVTVGEIEGRVVGWGSLSQFHPRAAYGRTVENSVYVHHEWQRRGVGRAILADLIARARELGYHTIIAGIDGEQAASAALHAGMGFVRVGKLREVGFKFGRWLDVYYMQLMIASPAEAPSP